MNSDGGHEHELDGFLAGVEKKAYHIAHAALWDQNDALDAVQESMMRLVKYYRDKPSKDWPALFRTILNSQVNDVRRKRMVQQARGKIVSLTGLGRGPDNNEDDTEYEISDSDRSDGITGVESVLAGQQLGEHIQKAVTQLSWRQRQVFLLREMHGWNIKETALALGCSENSVKQHHFRAMGALRKQLGEIWEHEHD